MNRNERGSEVIQAVVAVPLLLMVVFAVVQVGGMLLSINRVEADLMRACRHMDTGGLALATNKATFIEKEILGKAGQLVAERLNVENVVLTRDAKKKELADSSAGLPVSQKTTGIWVAFDVSYDLPEVAVIPGLTGRTVTRSVVCLCVDDRLVEVGVMPR